MLASFLPIFKPFLTGGMHYCWASKTLSCSNLLVACKDLLLLDSI